MERIKALWSDATPVLRALFVTALSVLTGGLVYMLVGAESVDMAPLYTRLDPADAQELVEELDAIWEEWKEVAGEIEEMEVPLEKNDIQVESVRLFWAARA